MLDTSSYSVNSEIFSRVYFRETSHMGSFVKIKSSQNVEITQSFTDIGKSCPSPKFLASQICLNAIPENKILAKISGFTVVRFTYLRKSLSYTTNSLHA